MSTLAAQKTVLNIKIDAGLKKTLQETARAVGLPVSTIANNLFKQFVLDRSITFTDSGSYTPNARTAKVIDEALQDYKDGKNISGPFDSIDDLMTSLQS